LIALAVVLLIAGIVDFLDGSSGPISAGAPILLDRVLLVLILVEIVYTVVLSLRAHRLVAQPFIVVGLIAVVRRILFVLTPGSTAVSTAELALLIAMVAVFIAGLVVVSHFEKGDNLGQSSAAMASSTGLNGVTSGNASCRATPGWAMILGYRPLCGQEAAWTRNGWHRKTSPARPVIRDVGRVALAWAAS